MKIIRNDFDFGNLHNKFFFRLAQKNKLSFVGKYNLKYNNQYMLKNVKNNKKLIYYYFLIIN